MDRSNRLTKGEARSQRRDMVRQCVGGELGTLDPIDAAIIVRELAEQWMPEAMELSRRAIELESDMREILTLAHDERIQAIRVVAKDALGKK